LEPLELQALVRVLAVLRDRNLLSRAPVAQFPPFSMQTAMATHVAGFPFEQPSATRGSM
jgi:hypothetical protein